MTFAEIGRELGISEFCAKWTFYQAIKKLRRECKRLGISPADILGAPLGNLASAETWSDA